MVIIPSLQFNLMTQGDGLIEVACIPLAVRMEQHICRDQLDK